MIQEPVSEETSTKDNYHIIDEVIDNDSVARLNECSNLSLIDVINKCKRKMA